MFVLRSHLCGKGLYRSEHGLASLPVAFNLSNVSHATNTETEILSVEGSSDGAGDGGLPYSWRAIEA